MITLAVMQGRLSAPEEGRFQSFPKNSWQEEFPRAAEIGIPAIEWIDDTYGGNDNPLRSSDGVQHIRLLMEKHGVTIPSICADSFMEEPLIRCTDAEREERLQLLELLLHQAKEVGAQHIGIPLLDNSALKSNEEIEEVTQALQRMLPLLERLKMELHFETSLHPTKFEIFLSALDHPLIRVTYDTGNSAALGYNPHEEFAAYGNRIGSVHIKDRVLNGGTVKLGTGDTDFSAVAAELKNIDFHRLFTLQGARGDDGEEIALIQEYNLFAERMFGVSV